MRMLLTLLYFFSFLCFGLACRNLGPAGSWREGLERLGRNLAGHTGFRLVAGAILGWVLAGIWGIAAGAGFAAIIPPLAASRRQRRQQARLELQLLDGLTLMQGGLQAGFNLFQVLELVAREMEPPLAAICSRIISEVQLGVPMDTAWERAGQQVSNETFSQLVTAVTIQRQMGGDLVFVLGTLRESLRQKLNLASKLKSVTSQGRLTGIVVAALPIALGTIIHVILPEFIRPLLVDPIGQLLLGIALALDMVGTWMISRICQLDP